MYNKKRELLRVLSKVEIPEKKNLTRSLEPEECWGPKKLPENGYQVYLKDSRQELNLRIYNARVLTYFSINSGPKHDVFEKLDVLLNIYSNLLFID